MNETQNYQQEDASNELLCAFKVIYIKCQVDFKQVIPLYHCQRNIPFSFQSG